MNQPEKFIRRCRPAEKEAIAKILSKLGEGDLTGLDVKKLKGSDTSFRIRKGDIRIIFFVNQEKRFIVEKITYRSDHTY